MANFAGTINNDIITGTADIDVVDFSQGGSDTVNAGGGDDQLGAGATLNAADQIDGGANYDTLSLWGNYVNGVTFGANTVVNVENVHFGVNFNYAIASHDNTVAAGQVLRLDAHSITAGNSVLFNGSAETDGSFHYYDGFGSDIVTGGAQADAFILTFGGDDIAHGGGGADLFGLGGTLTVNDVIDGGAGSDVVHLDGDYSTPLTLDGSFFTSIETILFHHDFAYNIAATDSIVPAGQIFNVTGDAISGTGHMVFNGAAEIDGTFYFTDSINNDAITGGQSGDVFFTAMGGHDALSGMGGNDFFELGATLDTGDFINGGDGNDRVQIAGDYAAGLTLAAFTIMNVEEFGFAGGFDYDIQLVDTNVAAGESLAVLTGTLEASDALTFDGSAETDGRFAFYTGSADEVLIGGGADDGDYFDLGGGGNDTVAAAGGNDTVQFWDTFTPADFVDGGAGTDHVFISHDYAGALTLGSASIQNVERITLGGDFDYHVIAQDSLVAAGATLSVDGYYLPSDRSMLFDGSAETDGSFRLVGGVGDDTLIGGAGADEFDLAGPGDDVHIGNGGADVFGGSYLTAADRIDGGAGDDTLYVDADVTEVFVFEAQTVQNVERIVMAAGNDVALTLHDGNVASGELMTIDAHLVPAPCVVVFDGSAETDGRFHIIGGASTDTFIGGAGNDIFDARAGSDSQTGGTGNDTFVYGQNFGADTITDFVAGEGTDDRINLAAYAAIASLDDVLALATQMGADTLFDFGNGDTLTLQNVIMTNLAAQDFVFAGGQNHAPAIMANGGAASATITVAENTIAVSGALGATDADGDPLTYAIVGGADHALFAIDPVTGALSFIATPDYEAPADAGANNSYIVQVSASDGSMSDTQIIAVNVTDVFDAGNVVAPLDGVLWRHNDGTVVTADHDLGTVSNDWQIAGSGDFDGDGDADVLWRHNSGMTVVWELENGMYVINHNLPSVPMSWTMSATGDFDGDGDSDLVWRNDGGATVTWEMEDGNYVVNHNLPDVPSTWHVAGVYDFDADGDADMLWRNDQGMVVIWQMQDGAYMGNHNLPSAPMSWHIAATGDVDGDADGDIVWRNDAGATVTWEIESNAFVTNHNLATVPTTWEIAGAEDFDSDGDADILWRHDDGQLVTWEMEQGALVTNHNHGSVANVWHIAGTGNFGLM